MGIRGTSVRYTSDPPSLELILSRAEERGGQPLRARRSAQSMAVAFAAMPDGEVVLSHDSRAPVVNLIDLSQRADLLFDLLLDSALALGGSTQHPTSPLSPGAVTVDAIHRSQARVDRIALSFVAVLTVALVLIVGLVIGLARWLLG